MEELPREFCRLDELAEKRGWTQDHLQQMAAAGKLVLSCFFKGNYKGVLCSSGENPVTDRGPSRLSS
ncbi:MAG: hypothetical protein WBB19_02985 [Desulforhopalus sp.]